jgi:subtilisin family serine protease
MYRTEKWMKNNKVIGAVSAAALAVGLIGTAVAPAAAATGPETTYLVLAPQGKSTDKAAARVAAAGGTVVAAYDQIGVLVARSTSTAFAGAVAGAGVESVASTEGLGTTLIDDDVVEAVDTAAVAAAGDPTAEPLWSSQWDMAQIDVAEAHAVTTGDPSIVVGVLDSGIDANHPDLATQVAKDQSASCLGGVVDTSQAAWSPTNSSHGTHVAGTIAAKANNATGVAGVAFNANLSICKALYTAAGTGLTSDVSACISWIHARGAKVISMSLGGGASTTLQQAVQRAWENGGPNGSVLVAAAGNDGDATLNYPAAYAEVVSVAATDHNDARASFSNANADVEIAAPGVDVLSTIPGGQYAKLSGTSMATPHVSGVTGVLWQLFPADTAAGIRSRLDASVNDLGAAGRDSTFGFGRVNLCKAAGGGC